MRPQYGIPAFEGTTYTPDDFERMRPRSFEDSARPVDSYEWLGATPESMPIDARVQQQQEADALAKQSNAKKMMKSGFGKAKEALNRPVFQSRGQTDINYDPRYADRLGQMMVLSDENSKQRIQDLEGELTNMYAALGGEQAGQRRPGGDFSQVGSYSYEYKDPTAQGAAAGQQAGPMAQELRGLPGVVKPGPDGFDRVDPARLSLTNASATGELAREVESLRKDVATLGGNPDAVLSRVNKPQTAPRRGRAVAADVDIGDVTTEADTGDYDLTSLEGAGRFNQETLLAEERAKKIAANRTLYNEARANGFDLPPLQTAVETTREYDGPRQREEIDFDQRQEDELRAMAMYGTTDAERQANIKRALDQSQMEGDHLGVVKYRPAAPGSVVNNLNVGPRTGRTVGNVSEDEVRRALQRREELFL